MSFRLPGDLVEALKQRAQESGLPATALVERYVGEGLRRDEHPLIVFRDGASGRRAGLVGSRLDVAHVVDTLEASQASGEGRLAEVAEYLELPVTLVRAAVRYYADQRDEVEAWRRRNRAIAERERAAWERERAVLG